MIPAGSSMSRPGRAWPRREAWPIGAGVILLIIGFIVGFIAKVAII
jgi:hypothetical protein